MLFQIGMGGIMKILMLILLFCSFLDANSTSSNSKDYQKSLDIIINSYNYLHQIPEMGHEEFKSTEFLISQIQSMGSGIEIIKFKKLKTGFIAFIDTRKEGKTTAFRAELDARPINESSSNVPISKVKGMMHACGHDIHSSILLGLVNFVAKNRNQFKGKFVFIFQPAEEVKGGADDIVNSGILMDLNVNSLFSLHVAPNLKVSEIAISKGISMASSSYFDIELFGKASHVASVEKGSKLPIVASKINENIHKYFNNENSDTLVVISRMLNCNKEFAIPCNQGLNVIPAYFKLSGSIRSFKAVLKKSNPMDSVEEKIRNIIEKNLNKDTDYRLNIKLGSPVLKNDSELYEQLVPYIKKNWQGKIDLNAAKSFYSEDFSYYTESIASLYFMLGIQKGEMGKSVVHSSEFNAHPDSFKYGLDLYILISKYLN